MNYIASSGIPDGRFASSLREINIITYANSVDRSMSGSFRL